MSIQCVYSCEYDRGMNFLAHLHLSGSDDQLRIGNFIADSVKGADYRKFPEGIRKGILMHRAIDHFSDNHPVFLKSVDRFRPRYRKYAGVVVDIVYDHFLATDWHSHSDQSLEDFASDVHALMLRNVVLIPSKSLMFLKYAIRTNRLVSYRTLEGIDEVFYGMSRRTRFNSGMETAVEELRQFYPELQEEFRQFYAEARKEFLL